MDASPYPLWNMKSSPGRTMAYPYAATRTVRFENLTGKVALSPEAHFGERTPLWHLHCAVQRACCNFVDVGRRDTCSQLATQNRTSAKIAIFENARAVANHEIFANQFSEVFIFFVEIFYADFVLYNKVNELWPVFVIQVLYFTIFEKKKLLKICVLTQIKLNYKCLNWDF